MSEQPTVTALQHHTLTTLLDTLVGGHSISLVEDNEQFRLSSETSFRLLGWYRLHRDKWSKNVTKEDVEGILTALDAPPAVVSVHALAATGTSSTRQLFVKSVCAHRFAGIHRFGDLDAAPDDFCFSFERPITLVEGANGAGKSSFLNAIVWCVTGYINRPLRPPEEAKTKITVNVEATQGCGADPAPSRIMSPLTPMPDAKILHALGENPLPLDTWVEISLCDRERKYVGTAKRKLQRGAQNAVVIKEPDFETLGLQSLGREVGTRLPGLLPYIQLDTGSDLGQAIAALIGIRPLHDLAKHAQRVHGRLMEEIIPGYRKDAEQREEEFRDAGARLNRLLGLHQELRYRESIPSPDDTSITEDLLAWQNHFENRIFAFSSG